MAGYSGTPQAKKLGITDRSTVALVGAPPGVIGGLPAGVTVKGQARGKADVVVAFFITKADYERRIGVLGRMIFPSGGLWIAWPKRSSGVDTTMHDEVVRQVALPLGWSTTRCAPSTTRGRACGSYGDANCGSDLVGWIRRGEVASGARCARRLGPRWSRS